MLRSAIILVVCFASGFIANSALCQQPEPSPAKPTRVMSFNIRYGTAPDGVNSWDKRKEFLASTIAEFDPDLLGTQETLADQRDFLAVKLPLHVAFGAGRDDGKQAGEMAALFYRKDRYEKKDGGHFWLSETPDQVGSKGWDAALPRIATWVKLKDLSAPADARTVLFLNAHLDHRGQKARAESTRLIRAKVAELGQGCRIVLTGDFNAGEGSPPYVALFSELDGKASPLVDSLRVSRPDRGKDEGTFSGFKASEVSGERIDWIACSRDWEVRQAGIDRTAKEGRTPSDHFPVTAVLSPAELKPTKADAPRAYFPYVKPTLIAHRGASFDAPEHTLIAYELAIKQGADFVEPDLQMTKDGVLVCIHDTTLERTTDVAKVYPDRARISASGRKSWPVADFTWEEIQKLDAGSWKDAKFKGTPIPSLQQMIDLVQGKAGIIPETKAPEIYGALGLDMEKALMLMLEKNKLHTPGANLKTPVIIQSFSEASLKKLRKTEGCKLPLVFLFTAGDSSIERLKQIKQFADGIAPNKSVVLARPAIVADAHSLDLSVTIWTCRAGQTGKFENVKAEMQYFLKQLNVDAIFTDNSDQFPRE